MNWICPSIFLSLLRGGSLRIACDGIPSIILTAAGKFRVIDIIDIPAGVTKRPGVIKSMSEAKDLARSLAQEGITLEVRLHGEPVFRLGKTANPKIARIVTLSGNIEVVDLRRLKKMSDALG